MSKPKPQLYWHIHHGVLMEPATEPIENRITYIKEEKPEDERALRLTLLEPVKGKLPQPVPIAVATYNKAWTTYRKAADVYTKGCETYSGAHDVYLKAQKARDKVFDDNMPAILALHEQECPNCPWDGFTIFPEQGE